MDTSFKPNFETNDIAGLLGYQQCLNHLYLFLAEKTEFNPAKRLIDAVDLLDIISETNNNIAKLYSKIELICNH